MKGTERAEAPVPPPIAAAVRGRAFVTARELARQFRLSEKTAREYLRRLAARGLLVRRAPGVFARRQGRRPELAPTAVLQRIDEVLQREAPFTDAVGWTTEWLIPYVRNLPMQSWVVLEASSTALPTLADLLQRAGIPSVLNPNAMMVKEAQRLLEQPVVLFPHRDMRALKPGTGLRRPEPERFLVDVFVAATRRGLPYSPQDLDRALRELIVNSDLDMSKVMAYAERRHALPELVDRLRKLGPLPADIEQALAARDQR